MLGKTTALSPIALWPSIDLSTTSLSTGCSYPHLQPRSQNPSLNLLVHLDSHLHLRFPDSSLPTPPAISPISNTRSPPSIPDSAALASPAKEAECMAEDKGKGSVPAVAS